MIDAKFQKEISEKIIANFKILNGRNKTFFSLK